MKGSVEDCGVLQVDGHFEASAQSNDLKVSESGIFVGDADVHNAEIVGRFEGNLNVKDRLVIRSTGVVTGTVRYGGIAIENGGKITGDIQAILKNEPPAEAAAPEGPAAAEKPETEPAQERKPLRLNLPDSQPDPADTVESEPPTTGA
jgi:cytoskeletal protein CcmA (bactofilin family)